MQAVRLILLILFRVKVFERVGELVKFHFAVINNEHSDHDLIFALNKAAGELACVYML